MSKSKSTVSRTTKAITFGESISSRAARVRAVLASRDIGARIEGLDADFLSSLLRNSIEAAGGWPEVEGLDWLWFVRLDEQTGHRGLRLVAGGSAFMPGIRRLAGADTRRAVLTSGLRTAVASQAAEVRGRLCRCGRAAEHVHHEGLSFAEIVDAFVAEHGVAERINVRVDDTFIARHPPDYLNAFAAFHKARAKLSARCRVCHGADHLPSDFSSI